ATHGGEGKILAGGQSLVPAMNFRLARPASLIDINRIDSLDYVREDEGELRIGALARHARFEGPVAGGALGAFLPRVARHIGHYPIRTRGTFCGSIAHADPAAEWCLVAAALGAEMVTRSAAGTRTIPAQDFFRGIMTTALNEDELLTEVRLPVSGADSRFGFYEFNRRAGDFALGMALVSFRLQDGVICDPRVAVGGIEPQPRRIADAERALAGRTAARASFETAAAAVWTAADIADVPPIDFREGRIPALEPYRQPVLATEKVRYVGEPVAAVFADDPYVAEDAAELVALEVEELPVLLAAEAEPVEFFTGRTTEVCIVRQGYGDVDAVLRAAPMVVELELAIGRHSGVPLETRGAIGRYDAARNILQLHGAAKAPHRDRDLLARMPKRAPSSIHVLESHVGRGFGTRGQLYPERVLVC